MKTFKAARGAVAAACLMISLLLLMVAGTASAKYYAAAAWGDNLYGQLGNGTVSEDDGVPGPVTGLSGATAVSAGQFHSLALLSNGTVAAWGENGFGQLGNGNDQRQLVPVAVSGLNGVTAISHGAWDSFALMGDGSAMAWG